MGSDCFEKASRLVSKKLYQVLTSTPGNDLADNDQKDFAMEDIRAILELESKTAAINELKCLENLTLKGPVPLALGVDVVSALGLICQFVTSQLAADIKLFPIPDEKLSAAQYWLVYAYIDSDESKLHVVKDKRALQEMVPNKKRKRIECSSRGCRIKESL